MLSRIAESLFWVGRYIERAEDTARIVDVHIHQLLEGPTVEEATACATLLGVMGVAPGPGPLDAARATRLLAFDNEQPSSIVASLIAARATARGARDAISSEMWECLNTTYNALSTQLAVAASVTPHGFFHFIKERSAAFAGLTDSTMSRDDAWRFLVLGRSIERVDMIARLLSAAPQLGTVDADWALLLRSCSAHEAFLRTYRREPSERLVAEFLLLDRLFPRSIFHALSTAEECLLELDPTSSRAGVEDEARRLLGQARTELEFRRVQDLLDDLLDQLLAIQAACSAASDALAARYFRRSATVEWNLDRAGVVRTPASA